MQQYIEEEIIKQLRDPAHQRDAFAQVVNFYGEKLYWQIRKMVLDHDDANDLLQNTFLKAWMNIDYFRGEAKLSTWLYKIAINECITFLNRQRVQNFRRRFKSFLSSCGEESRGVFNKRHLNLSCYHLSKEHKREMI